LRLAESSTASAERVGNKKLRGLVVGMEVSGSTSSRAARQTDILTAMKGLILTLALFMAVVSTAFAGTYRVSYTLKGSGRKITVQAESTAEARRVVEEMLPGCYVTGVHRIKR
jgi:hypothetical protein